MIWLLIFIISIIVLFWSGSRLVKGLIKMAVYLGWREFVVAFFIVAFAGAVPNLFIGINSALHGIPELSFGEILGGNVVDLTLAVALAVLVGGNVLQAKSKMVQSSTIFTSVVAILPLILIIDGRLGRIDGAVLLLAFIFYVVWLFSKEERFRKVYKGKLKEENAFRKFVTFVKKRKEPKIIKEFKIFVRGMWRVVSSLILLMLASWGIVRSAQFFAGYFNVSLPIVGIFLVGLGNALPETYFAIISARKGQTWMILGDLMGSVIVCATLILGVVALIAPIEIVELSTLAIARVFLVISAVFFLVIVRTGQKITKKEAAILLIIYLSFIITEFLLT